MRSGLTRFLALALRALFGSLLAFHRLVVREQVVDVGGKTMANNGNSLIGHKETARVHTRVYLGATWLMSTLMLGTGGDISAEPPRAASKFSAA